MVGLAAVALPQLAEDILMLARAFYLVTLLLTISRLRGVADLEGGGGSSFPY
jgi:hypothetical protein